MYGFYEIIGNFINWAFDTKELLPEIFRHNKMEIRLWIFYISLPFRKMELFANRVLWYLEFASK